MGFSPTAGVIAEAIGLRAGDIGMQAMVKLIWSPVGSAHLDNIRVLHCPNNVSGTATELAEGLRARGIPSDAVLWKAHPFWPNDGYVVRNRWLQLLFFFAAVRHFNVFHFYFGQSLLPLNIDLPILKLLGKRTFMNYVGSDCRITFVDSRENLFAPLYYGSVISRNNPARDQIKLLSMRWHSLWVNAAITGPKSREFLKEVYDEDCIVSHVRLNNTAAWRHIEAREEYLTQVSDCIKQKETVVVVHAPSNPRLKGTKYVRASIQEIQRDFPHLEYRELTGMPSAEIIEALASADIVVDQLLLGTIGTLAWEAMLLRKPVVAHVTDSHYQRDFPEGVIWRATVEDLTPRLRELLHSPKRRAECAESGHRFALSALNRNHIYNELINLYQPPSCANH